MNTICQKCGCQTAPDQMNGVCCLACVPVHDQGYAGAVAEQLHRIADKLGFPILDLETAATVKDDFEMFTELSLTNGSNAGSFLVTNGAPMNLGSVLSRFCDFGKSCAWEVNYVSASRLRDDENGWIEIKARVRKVGGVK